MDDKQEFAQFPLWIQRTVGGKRFLCVRKTDAEKANVHVIGEHGENYGAWMSDDAFVTAYKHTQTPPDGGESSSRVAALLPTVDVLGRSALSVRSIS